MAAVSDNNKDDPPPPHAAADTERAAGRPCGLSRSRSLPQFSHHDSGLESYYGGSGGEEPPASRTARFVADIRQLITLKQHYYPEGGWGWVVLWTSLLVHILAHGFLASAGLFQLEVMKKFECVGAISTGISLLISPIVVAFCRTRSTRVTAVMGGLVTALGCLFTSFATQFHQLLFSYVTVIGVGVGITRDCSTLMVAQYFKRRREFVEVFILMGSGLGICLMSLLIKTMINSLGWRLGLQVITGMLSITFILGTFYRSASLYHPQRRAILHIKNQKRKIRDKNRLDDKPPFFDCTALRSVTVRILVFSTMITSFGIGTPLFYLAYQAKLEGLEDWVVLIQIYLGISFAVGCIIFSTLVLHKTSECRVSRQYLCQSAVFMCGLSILAFTMVKDNYHAFVMFACIYGFFYGGYCYSLKMYTYERVRARHFSRTWGFVQFSQALPIAIGVPFSGYLSDKFDSRAGYYFSSICTIIGSLALFLTDLHRHRISHHKHTRENGTRHLCINEACPQSRKLSFSQEPENDHVLPSGAAAAATAYIFGPDAMQHNSGGMTDNLVASGGDKGELTCISEEGIADMDLPDDILDDLDYIGDCITSCNKVENYLMLSEFENNLFAEMPSVLDKKGRRWSLAAFLHNRYGDRKNSSGNENEPEENVVENEKADKITELDESSL